MKLAFVFIALFSLAGCTSMQPAPIDAIEKLPVIRVGEQTPPNSEYVVFYPAGFEFPVKLKASGSLFAAERKIESQATLSRNLYLYKHWASHDGKLWKNSHELLGVEFGGGFDVNGLQANIKLEAK